LPAGVSAADYTAGVDYAAGTATLWFRSNVNTQWADAHYRLDNGAQQNLRMGFNAGAGRFELKFPASAARRCGTPSPTTTAAPPMTPRWAAA
jgi:hypothetical protein